MNEEDKIFSDAVSAIRPAMWFTNSILTKSTLATKEELGRLNEMTKKTIDLKRKTWKIDNDIANLLSKIDKRELSLSEKPVQEDIK